MVTKVHEKAQIWSFHEEKYLHKNIYVQDDTGRLACELHLRVVVTECKKNKEAIHVTPYSLIKYVPICVN